MPRHEATTRLQRIMVKMRVKSVVAGCLTVVCIVLLAVQMAVGEPSDRWLTGDPLRKKLSRNVGFVIQGNTLRGTLSRIGKEYRVATMLDRRLDPDRRIDYSVRDISLGELLSDLARQLGIGMTWLGPVAYFGPPENVSQLKSLLALRREEIKRLPPAVRKRLARNERLTWEPLSSPEELLGGVCRIYGLNIENIDVLPHDLWARGELPALDFATQMTLLVAGFGFTFQTDAAGEEVYLVRIPARVIVERFYAVPKRELAATLRQLAAGVPDAEVQVDQGRIAVRGRVEDHQQVASLLGGGEFQLPAASPKQSARSSAAKQIYTLRVRAPLAAVLATLSRQVGFKLQLQREAIAAADIDLAQIVSVDLEDLELNELLSALLGPVGLTFRRQQDAIEVLPLGR